jgi:hypothetical protein
MAIAERSTRRSEAVRRAAVQLAISEYHIYDIWSSTATCTDGRGSMGAWEVQPPDTEPATLGARTDSIQGSVARTFDRAFLFGLSRGQVACHVRQGYVEYRHG